MKSVTVVIPTRNRYTTTLPLCLMSVVNQTYKPEKVIIYDDGEQKDLRKEPVFFNIFSIMLAKGIKWEVKFGQKKGQVFSHQRSLTDATTEWIWRIDDDNIAEPDVLEKLMNNAGDDVGAIGGLVIDPKMNTKRPALASNKIEDIYMGLNIQWFNQEPHIEEVDHLYSTFVFRRAAALVHGYCLETPIHREETIFTYDIKREGWRILVDASAKTWHLNEQSGGIRDDKRAVFEHCERVFSRKMQEWGVEPTKTKLCVLDCGMGDHIVFKKVLKTIQEKNKGRKIIIASCYPEIFKNEDVVLISIGEAKMMTSIDKYNVYKYLWDNKGRKLNLEEAFRELYEANIDIPILSEA